jgi:hypothetical protein
MHIGLVIPECRTTVGTLLRSSNRRNEEQSIVHCTVPGFLAPAWDQRFPLVRAHDRSMCPLQARDSSPGIPFKYLRPMRRHKSVPRQLSIPRPNMHKEPPEVPEIARQNVTDVAEAMAALRRLLRGRSILAHVASLADCEFVRFTGVVFERCHISDRCPDGIPPEMEPYQRDVCFIIVSVPPGLVARSLSPPKRRSPAACEKFAAYLHYANPRLGAVYERQGVDVDVLAAEQDLAEKQDNEYYTQLDAWCDIGTSRRIETDLTNPAGISLFEEPRIDSY